MTYLYGWMLGNLHVTEFTGMMSSVVNAVVSWMCVDMMMSSIKHCCLLGFHCVSWIIPLVDLSPFELKSLKSLNPWSQKSNWSLSFYLDYIFKGVINSYN